MRPTPIATADAVIHRSCRRVSPEVRRSLSNQRDDAGDEGGADKQDPSRSSDRAGLGASGRP
jgi:hypothetical protein